MIVDKLSETAEEQIVAVWLTPQQGLAITTFRITDGMEEAAAVVVDRKDLRAFRAKVDTLIDEVLEVRLDPL